MIDISGKGDVRREAEASGSIRLTPGSIDAVRKGTVKKGDALEVARVAGILAVKRTHEIIPHCHPIPVEGCEIRFDVHDDSIRVHCRVRARYRTGVEMEALTGVSAALLALWDMLKYLEKDASGQYPRTSIEGVRVDEKLKAPGA